MAKKIPNRIPRMYRTEDVHLNDEIVSIKGFRAMDDPILLGINRSLNKARRLGFKLDSFTVLRDEQGNIVYDDVTTRNIDPEGNVTERVAKEPRKRPEADLTDKELDELFTIMDDAELVKKDVIPLQHILAKRAIRRFYNPKIKPSEIEDIEKLEEMGKLTEDDDEYIELNDGEATGIFQIMQQLGEPLAGFRDFQKMKKK